MADGRHHIQVLAEFTLRVPANMRRDIRNGSQEIKDRLAAGTYTVSAAERACRSLGNNLAETSRQYHQNYRTQADSRVLTVLGLTSQQLTDSMTDIHAGIGHLKNDPAATEGEINTLCNTVLAAVPAADDPSDAAGTRFKPTPVDAAVALMRDP